jgi:hypothetical protein
MHCKTPSFRMSGNQERKPVNDLIFSSEQQLSNLFLCDSKRRGFGTVTTGNSHRVYVESRNIEWSSIPD